ncbi:hypothetical protein GLOIN_2v1778806 [Rhizophagus irregularis DAOM 181602=DAOM 197198]|uniref:Galactose oxidase n=1 Tax=Rhizophagus irregularis (strain DAOM 181602 / DAOM 197198 / MUCL 43194) TaxID=747089 RepID=A0A2P4PRJ6_RHIID|nr:hypothetical protein GLOIN_2v1778806 [Rhizophagus irregularis DAOM 181602=DAOM 197198]POG67993.1 hypothetical protein GLOIN_2v1778806 [Rhizophagus irregularis DAOM 181602=DAOM 197198]|eukprot:XP_025174859.1 hypothetical protein GLOIN_2v1778806 [Rhizophagus irregularis DAOM 181602=DAOM 197198]
MGFIVLVDLAGISLDTDELVKNSKWIDLTADIKPKPDNLFYDHPIPSGNKIMFLEEFASNFYVNIFDTTLKKWNINQNVKILQPMNPITSIKEVWTFDEKTGKSYLLPNFFHEKKRVLVPNGQILFIGGQVNDVDNLLIYDTINDTIDTWQIVNTTGKTTEVPSDGRVIVFDGVLKPSVPALSHLSVLDTSKIPYECRNLSNNDPLINSGNDDLYKLNVTDPLKYKWFAPIQTEASAAASSS